MKNPSIQKNYLYNVAYQVMTLLTPFIVTPYLARTLGAEGVGIYSYTSSVVAYFILVASLGINMYAQREVSYHRNNAQELAKIFYEVQIFHALLVTINIIAYFCFIKSIHDNYTIFYIQSLNILAVFFDISWFFFGMEEFSKIVLRNFVVRILNIVGIIFIVRSFSDLPQYTLLMAGLNFFSGLIMWSQIIPYLRRIPIADIHPFRNTKIIIQMFLPQIVGSVYLVMDKTMLGVIGGSSFENGYYQYAEQIAKIPLALLTSLGTVLMPRIAYAFSDNDYRAIRDYMKNAVRYTWFSSVPVCFGLAGIADTFVPWFFGDSFDKVIPLVWILSGITVFISFGCLYGPQYMVSVGKQNYCTIANSFGAIVNLMLNFLLIPRFLSIGSAIATFFAELVVTIVLMFFLRHELPIKQYMIVSSKYIISGTIMLIVLRIVASSLAALPSTTILLILLGVVVYVLSLALLRDSMLLAILSRVRSLIYFKR